MVSMIDLLPSCEYVCPCHRKLPSCQEAHDPPECKTVRCFKAISQGRKNASPVQAAAFSLIVTIMNKVQVEPPVRDHSSRDTEAKKKEEKERENVNTAIE